MPLGMLAATTTTATLHLHPRTQHVVTGGRGRLRVFFYMYYVLPYLTILLAISPADVHAGLSPSVQLVRDTRRGLERIRSV